MWTASVTSMPFQLQVRSGLWEAWQEIKERRGVGSGCLSPCLPSCQVATSRLTLPPEQPLLLSSGPLPSAVWRFQWPAQGAACPEIPIPSYPPWLLNLRTVNFLPGS